MDPTIRRDEILMAAPLAPTITGGFYHRSFADKFQATDRRHHLEGATRILNTWPITWCKR